jgi:hypothetical protein
MRGRAVGQPLHQGMAELGSWGRYDIRMLSNYLEARIECNMIHGDGSLPPAVDGAWQEASPRWAALST